jgi:hypothetical protein
VGLFRSYHDASMRHSIEEGTDRQIRIIQSLKDNTKSHKAKNTLDSLKYIL